jgi:hypothetical protein
MEDRNHDLGLSSRHVMARTSSKAIIASPSAAHRLLHLLNDPEVAMPPLLNLFTAPAGRRCFLTLFPDAVFCRRPLIAAAGTRGFF